MKILLTGATGYIGSRLLPLLIKEGFCVYACSRTEQSLCLLSKDQNCHFITVDFLNPSTFVNLPDQIDVAYYLMHSMSYGASDFAAFEMQCVKLFLQECAKRGVKQIIYLSGLCNDDNLSPHLKSRYAVEKEIKKSKIPYTILRAGIIIGPGSASFEIIRDLTEKLPIMITPKWVNNLCQPIASSDVLYYLLGVIQNEKAINQVFDIGGKDVLSYKEMMLGYARERGLKRKIFTVPVLTPKLSSYWLYFVTSVNFSLTSSLVDSVKNCAICKNDEIKKILPKPPLDYKESLIQALDVKGESPVFYSWKETLIDPKLEASFDKLVEVPTHGCFIDKQQGVSKASFENTVRTIFEIGGKNGWYYMDWAWEIRGFIDKLVGGVGLQRGRFSSSGLKKGSTLDFWRVITADVQDGHLLLYAEMKVPGDAWLEFRCERNPQGTKVTQTASFRPKGLLGRLYWYLLFPFHFFIFKGLLNEILKRAEAVHDRS